MAVELRRAEAADIPELGRICYEAFKGIAESHGFQSDFASVEFAQQVIGMLMQQEDIYSIAAVDGGAAKGSNFMEMWDEVAGVGPVSVDVSTQGQGIGRRLVEEGIAQARKQGFEMIRLTQESFNMRSLALYASMGFDTKEPLAYLALAGSQPVDDAFRPATVDDLPAMDELCRSVYHVSRTAECAAFMRVGIPTFVLDRGHIAGYLTSLALGHGVAESEDDMLALLAGVGATVPESHSIVPLRSGELYRRALAAGHRNSKVMNLMALGPYEEPQGAYCPSAMF